MEGATAVEEELAEVLAAGDETGDGEDEGETEGDLAAISAANATGDPEVTIEELAEEGAPTPPMQLPLPGTIERISLSAGGASPTSSEARLLGGSMPIEGQYAKGEVLTFVVEVKVTGIEFIDKTDDWGTVERTVRRHKLRMLSVRKAGA